MAIMKSYPALGDTALPLSLLALWIHIFPCKPILVMGIAFRLIKYHFIENKQGMRIVWSLSLSACIISQVTLAFWYVLTYDSYDLLGV